MRQFAAQAIHVLGTKALHVSRMTLTIHGAGYGLDEEEALLSLVAGFEEALAREDHVNLALSEICFVERKQDRAERLAAVLRQRVPAGRPNVTTRATRAEDISKAVSLLL